MSSTKKQVRMMCISAMLIALGVLIPMISPVKIILEPMSFTLGSHVAIMAAMLISPFCALSVAVGTAAGFYLAGFTLPVVLRALSHIVWAYLGARCLQRDPKLLSKAQSVLVYTIGIALIHALCEVLVVLPLYTGYDASTLFYLLFVLVGVGTIVHSMVDFFLSLCIWKALCKSASLQQLANVKEVALFTKAM